MDTKVIFNAHFSFHIVCTVIFLKITLPWSYICNCGGTEIDTVYTYYAEELSQMSKTFTKHLTNIFMDLFTEWVHVVEAQLSLALHTSTQQRGMPSECSAIPWADRDPHKKFVQDPNEVTRWPEHRDWLWSQWRLLTIPCVSGDQATAKGHIHQYWLKQNQVLRHTHYEMPVHLWSTQNWTYTYVTLKSKLPKTCKDADQALLLA